MPPTPSVMRRDAIRALLLFLACASLSSPALSQTPDQVSAAASGGAAATAPESATAQRLAWWREARFGMFVHWGVASLTGGELSVSRHGRFGGLDGVAFKDLEKYYKPLTPAAEYDRLYQRFNPTAFNADEWTSLALEAGARYMVFTTKHCDGFNMFDSDLTTYTIMHSPFARDVTGELARACARAKIPLGFYYSPADWRHPDYRTERHERYVEYLHGQVRELCTKYGPVAILWFDDIWAVPEDWEAERLLAMVRQLQPNILINNRAGLPGDYETPEGLLGGPRPYEHFPADIPWETCRTIATQWGWRPDDPVTPLKDCIHTLVRCVGQDGNLLLNVSPRADGRIEPAQAQRMRELGAWLKQFGESIYGTRGGPYRDGVWGTSTHRDRTIYLHVLDWQGKYLYMPPPGKKITACRLLGSGKPVPTEVTREALRLEVAQADRDPVDTIIVLELDGPASEIRPRHPARIGFLDGPLP